MWFISHVDQSVWLLGELSLRMFCVSLRVKWLCVHICFGYVFVCLQSAVPLNKSEVSSVAEKLGGSIELEHRRQG